MIKILINISNFVGFYTKQFTLFIGKFVLFFLSILFSAFYTRIYFKIIGQQLIIIGFHSLYIIAIMAFSTGAVLALQSYIAFSYFATENTIPNIVTLSIIRELGPVLTGLIIAGKVGSLLTSEIAVMKITEQIDALYTLSINVMQYVFFPRLIGCFIALPFLVLISYILGIFGGYVVSIYTLKFNSVYYLLSTLKYLKFLDILYGLLKSSIFGLVIGSISCFFGFYVKNSAKSVGLASTYAVTINFIVILLSNYLITKFLYN